MDQLAAKPMRVMEKRHGEWMELRSLDGAPELEQWRALLLERYGVPVKLLKRLERDKELVMEGSRLRLKLFPEEAAAEQAEWAELDVLYEDHFCLVVAKPAGMPVHPTEPGQRGTLAHAVASYYEQTGQACRIRHIHRLDEDTTGPVLYAKNEYAHLILDEAMRDKRIRRTYWAIVQGSPKSASGIVDAPIGRDRHHPKRRRVSPGGDPARTRYRMLEKAAYAAMVELELETGRTHQIRVHMSHLGLPLVGDGLYGGSQKLLGRQALHGISLSFITPWNGEAIVVKVKPPEDWQALWRRLKAGDKP